MNINAFNVEIIIILLLSERCEFDAQLAALAYGLPVALVGCPAVFEGVPEGVCWAIKLQLNASAEAVRYYGEFVVIYDGGAVLVGWLVKLQCCSGTTGVGGQDKEQFNNKRA